MKGKWSNSYFYSLKLKDYIAWQTRKFNIDIGKKVVPYNFKYCSKIYILFFFSLREREKENIRLPNISDFYFTDFFIFWIFIEEIIFSILQNSSFVRNDLFFNLSFNINFLSFLLWLR